MGNQLQASGTTMTGEATLRTKENLFLVQSQEADSSKAIFSTRDALHEQGLNRFKSLLNPQKMNTKKQRPQTSKRIRPVASISSNPQTLRNQGPSSTKNIIGGTHRFGRDHNKSSNLRQGLVNREDNAFEEETQLESQIYETSFGDVQPDRVQSVAERSVLSQNFVCGTETSESQIGVEKIPRCKPIAYNEFKDAVRRKADTSDAPNHEHFMWEVSERKSPIFSNSNFLFTLYSLEINGTL